MTALGIGLGVDQPSSASYAALRRVASVGAQLMDAHEIGQTDSSRNDDPVQVSLARTEIRNKAVRGLFVLNGGASVALLAFLQEVWSTYPALADAVLNSLSVLLAGLVLASLTSALRYHASMALRSGAKGQHQILYSTSHCFQYASLVTFILAIGWLIIAAKDVLPSVGPVGP